MGWPKMQDLPKIHSWNFVLVFLEGKWRYVFTKWT
jgi:hypothetical protein